jgi:large subunit ribosomal protein L24
MKIRKGDKVRVMAGKDVGKEGVVEKVLPKQQKVLVANVNLFKRHLKPRAEGQKGQIVEVPRPLAVAKVALICPKCQQVTRVGYAVNGKQKSRICKKCKMEI